MLAYAVMDLQEAGALPGPFTEAAPIDPTSGAVAAGWSAFPFGWAFDVTAVIPPDSVWATILQATIGFMPRMTWIQVAAWTLYIVIVGFFFIRGIRSPRPASAVPTGSATSSLTQQGAA